MSTIKETTLHPENQPDVNLYPRTLATLVEGLDVAITTKAPRPVACKIVLPQGATKGTLTEEQLTILSASPQNYIEMVNDKELYYLNDPGHESGFYTYSHVGIENSKATIKTLTITVSAKSFVIVTTVVPTESGGVQFVEVYASRPLTEEQLTTLKANKSNQIIYYGGVKYYFKLAYEKSSTEWIYATFVDSAAILIVNMSSGSAVIHFVDRKYYRHLLKGTANAHFVSGSSVTSPVEYEMIFITDSADSMKVDDSTAQNDKLGEYAGGYITAYGTVRVKTSDEAPGTYYAFDACGFKHEGSPGIYSVSYLYMYDPTKYGQLNALSKVSAQIATVDSDTVIEI